MYAACYALPGATTQLFYCSTRYAPQSEEHRRCYSKLYSTGADSFFIFVSYRISLSSLQDRTLTIPCCTQNNYAMHAFVYHEHSMFSSHAESLAICCASRFNALGAVKTCSMCVSKRLPRLLNDSVSSRSYASPPQWLAQSHSFPHGCPQ